MSEEIIPGTDVTSVVPNEAPATEAPVAETATADDAEVTAEAPTADDAEVTA